MTACEKRAKQTALFEYAVYTTLTPSRFDPDSARYPFESTTRVLEQFFGNASLMLMNVPSTGHLRSVILGLCALSFGCTAAMPPGGQAADSQTNVAPTGKQIDLGLFDVVDNHILVPFSYPGVHRYTRAELPAQYTVLAAMPDSGPSFERSYSLAFDVNGMRTSIANIEPYYLTTAQPGYPAPWTSGLGRFDVKATAYEDKDGQGAVIGTATLSFEIVDS